jgi:hypothetical protein
MPARTSLPVPLLQTVQAGAGIALSAIIPTQAPAANPLFAFPNMPHHLFSPLQELSGGRLKNMPETF